MSKHQFCRDLCLERGEPHEGTGNAPNRVLMLAWPRGKWRTPRWESVDMSAALSEAIHRAAQSGLHVALIDQVGKLDVLPHLHALPESISACFESEADLIAAIQGYMNGEIFEGEHDLRITILVCTDSRRDACCARYGFSTYKALTALADPVKFNIVQATHLGGCRFAASLVVMPARQRYGRMTAGQVPAFLESLTRGEIYLPSYKGRTDQPEPLQVAELAALKWADDNRMPTQNIQLLEAALPDNPTEGEHLDLQVEVGTTEVGTTRLDIGLKARNFLVQGNCGEVAAGRGDVTLRWCLERLAAAPPNG